MAINQSDKQDRMVVNVDLEGIRGPAANDLYDMGRYAGLCYSSGTTSTHQVPRDVTGKMLAKLANEPAMGRDGAMFMQPELWVLREKAILGSKILHEMGIWVISTHTTANNYVVALEKMIGLVSW